ncbi:MAG: hypothetical protein JO353_06705 [Phycisphaerae bacterium]|nr:hypothetical protein [Phycisphaerae bacterium]
MSEKIPLEQASGRLSELVHSLGPTDEIVLTENEQPVARLLPSNISRAPRVPGTAKGQLTIVKEEEMHLASFTDYMP